MTADRPVSPLDQIRRAYEETERRTGQTLEDLVATEGFSDVLAMVVGNAMALTKVSGTVLDDLVRRTRLAGRSDLTGLGRQLARTEDKLELVLQHIEHLEDEVAALRAELAGSTAATPATAVTPAGATPARSPRRTASAPVTRTPAARSPRRTASAPAAASSPTPAASGEDA